MRLLFFLTVSLVLAYLFLKVRSMERSSEKPVFLQVDKLALAHQTSIDVVCRSVYCPDSLELQTLVKDYSNLWAHLNHLYATNDIITGKEYYTERWFKQLANHYPGKVIPLISRRDAYHELHIENWSSDGLLCTAIDRNILLEYTFPGPYKKTSQANLAIVLLYQGDHWRIDAWHVISETFN